MAVQQKETESIILSRPFSLTNIYNIIIFPNNCKTIIILLSIVFELTPHYEYNNNNLFFIIFITYFSFKTTSVIIGCPHLQSNVFVPQMLENMIVFQ